MIQSTWFHVNGIRLHAWTAGPDEGEPLLFLHGFPEMGIAWQKQLLYFAERGYRTIAPDQRGYNLSDKPTDVQDYLGEILKHDISELISQISKKPIVLVGHDWGAMVAWYLAIDRPELLKKLIVLNVPHPRVFARNLKHNWRQRLKSWYAAMFMIPNVPEWLMRQGRCKMLRNSLSKSSLPGTFSQAHFDTYVEGWTQTGALTAMINWYRALPQTDKMFVRNKEITVPTMILWGEQDQFICKELAAESAELCNEVILHTLPDATHWIAHEKPDFVNTHIENFIA